MWPGPYGEWGSRNTWWRAATRALKRMGLDYVDISTATGPTRTRRWKRLCRLDYIVRSGGRCTWISTYDPEQTRQASKILRIWAALPDHQPRNNMFDRWMRRGCWRPLREEGIGLSAFRRWPGSCDKYWTASGRFTRGQYEVAALGRQGERYPIDKVRRLRRSPGPRPVYSPNGCAWNLRLPEYDLALIGASPPEQVEEMWPP